MTTPLAPSATDLADGLHVAIIMDGNGRWARGRGLPRPAGHRAGGKAVRRTVEAAPELGIATLTLYAFSADNWQRPAAEVDALMELFERHLREETSRLCDNEVRLSVIGRRDRLPPRLVEAIEAAERATRGGSQLHLRIAVDYSARQAIAATAARLASAPASLTGFARQLNRTMHSVPAAPDVDLLIRTSGEQRLSDFLLWECAYAELHFTPRLWPDFGADDLASAVAEFRHRERRFGAVSPRLAAV
ncbi:MAG: di-trans,poly-cis-decaprenylcistransferase [Thermoanaerobaculia bacterium]